MITTLDSLWGIQEQVEFRSRPQGDFLFTYCDSGWFGNYALQLAGSSLIKDQRIHVHILNASAWDLEISARIAQKFPKFTYSLGTVDKVTLIKTYQAQTVIQQGETLASNNYMSNALAAWCYHSRFNVIRHLIDQHYCICIDSDATVTQPFIIPHADIMTKRGPADYGNGGEIIWGHCIGFGPNAKTFLSAVIDRFNKNYFRGFTDERELAFVLATKQFDLTEYDLNSLAVHSPGYDHRPLWFLRGDKMGDSVFWTQARSTYNKFLEQI